MSGDPAVAQVDEVRLSLPALARYARVASLAVTGLASRVGFSYDEVEDLRIAMGEISGLLLDGHGGRVTYRFTIAPDTLGMEATVSPPGPPRPAPELSRRILDAVADRVELDLARARVLVEKRRQGRS